MAKSGALQSFLDVGVQNGLKREETGGKEIKLEDNRYKVEDLN